MSIQKYVKIWRTYEYTSMPKISRARRLLGLPFTGLFSGGMGQVFINLAGLCFIYGLNIGTGVIVARILGPHGRGIATATGLWQPVTAALVTLGLPTAVNIAIQKSPILSGAITGIATKISFVTGVLSAVIGAAVLPYALIRYSSSDLHFAQASLILVPVSLIFGITLSSLQAQQRFLAFNILRTLPQILTLVSLIGLTFYESMNPYSANLAYMLPVLIVAPMALLLSRPSAARIRSPLTKDLLHYGFRSYGTEVVSGLGGSIDRLLVIMILSPTSVGLYLVARSLADVVMGLQQSVALVLLSKSGGGSPASIVMMTSLAARLGAAITLVTGVLIGSVAGWILPFVYGIGFERSTTIFRILIIDIVCTGLSITLGQAFHAVGRPGVMSTIQLSITALTVPLVMFGAYIEDYYGVAIAMSIISVLRLATVTIGYRIILNTKRPRLVVNLQDIRSLLSRFG